MSCLQPSRLLECRVHRLAALGDRALSRAVEPDAERPRVREPGFHEGLHDGRIRVAVRTVGAEHVVFSEDTAGKNLAQVVLRTVVLHLDGVAPERAPIAETPGGL